MEAFVAKMKEGGLPDAAIAAFQHNYEQLVGGADGMVPEDTIEAVQVRSIKLFMVFNEDLPKYEDLKAPDEATSADLLAATAVLKLNGGLGTSMGLEKAKSLLVVKEGKTFLDLIAEQVDKMRKEFGSNVRFIVMNSFSTSDDTKEHFSKTHPDLIKDPEWQFIQNKSPKVNAETLAPAEYPEHPDMEWCPPGHGDIYPALVGSGVLDKLRSAGIKYVFVSNSDNLGATLDLKLLQHFASTEAPFIMEVAQRTASDKKGGHLCRRKSDGKLLLRESAMIDDSDKPAFEDITKHKFFNTNNLWVNLDALKATMDAQGGMLPLPLIKNKKTVNPRDSSTPKVFQLETAMGSAIECFEGAAAVCVPRKRFAPVKTCADLFCLRSDAYTLTPQSTVELVCKSQPTIKLDDKHYKLVDKMEALVEEYPSLLDCESLKVTGPVKFGRGVAIKGKVEVENGGDKVAELGAGEYANTTIDVGVKVPATA